MMALVGVTMVQHVLSGFTQVTETDYDADSGAVSRLKYPSGLDMTYELDEQGQVVALEGTGGGGPYVVNDATYHPSGSPATIEWGTSLAVQADSVYQYDDRDRLTRMAHFPDSSSAEFLELELGLDEVGNVLTYAIDGESPPWTFSYDDLHRLTATSNGQWGDDTYTYDSAGNIKLFQRSGGTSFTRTHIYGSANRLWKRYNGETLDTVFLHDGAGQLTKKGATTFSWSPAGWLTSTSGGESYSYESSGMRVKRAGGGDPVYYEYDGGGRVLHEFIDGGTDTTVDYIYLHGRLVGKVTNGSALVLYFADHLGSPLLTRTTDMMQDECDLRYDPYGIEIGSNGCGSALQYNGRVIDGSGLYYYNARYYDPEIGRFISADSVLGKLGNPQSLNKYAYTLDNPYRYVDPNGREPINWDEVLSVVVVLAVERTGLSHPIEVEVDANGHFVVTRTTIGDGDTWLDDAYNEIDPENRLRVDAGQIGMVVKPSGPNGGARSGQDMSRLRRQRQKRARRREAKSRVDSGQKQSGEGFRDKSASRRAKEGSGESNRHGRERNVGIDKEEHSKRSDPMEGPPAKAGP